MPDDCQARPSDHKPEDPSVRQVQACLNLDAVTSAERRASTVTTRHYVRRASTERAQEAMAKRDEVGQ